jgi:hypothetical protein
MEEDGALKRMSSRVVKELYEIQQTSNALHPTSKPLTISGRSV